MQRYREWEQEKGWYAEPDRYELDFDDLPLTVASEVAELLQPYIEFRSIRELLAELRADSPLNPCK